MKTEETKKNKVIEKAEINPYFATITATKTNLYALPTSKSEVLCELKNGFTYIIIEEEKGFGKLKSGVGWISLKDIEVTENI